MDYYRIRLCVISWRANGWLTYFFFLCCDCESINPKCGCGAHRRNLTRTEYDFIAAICREYLLVWENRELWRRYIIDEISCGLMITSEIYCGFRKLVSFEPQFTWNDAVNLREKWMSGLVVLEQEQHTKVVNLFVSWWKFYE